MNERAHYGSYDATRYDISDRPALSLDLRALMGLTGEDDASCVAPVGTFRLSVHGVPDPDTGLFVGEVIVWLRRTQVHVVGALTGRPGLIEVTPDHLEGAFRDPKYAKQLRLWLGVAE